MFAGIYFHDRRARYTGWLTASYLSGVIAALLDIAQPHSPLARWPKPITSHDCFLSGINANVAAMALMALMAMAATDMVRYYRARRLSIR